MSGGLDGAAMGAPRRDIADDGDETVWLFTSEEVRLTPSRVAGVSFESEMHVLARTACFLQDCSRELLLPQLTISVALKFFQRFYMLESMLDHKPPKVAAACLFLSCKVQETHKRLKDIIYWTVKVRTRNTKDYPDGLDVYEDSPGYYDEKSAILDKEREVLRVLNFDLTCDHPYKHLWTLNKNFLPPTLEGQLPDKRAVTQSAWNFINDSFRTYMHVMYSPQVIATAALFLAAKLHGFPLADGTGRCPKTGSRLLAWHEYFAVNVDDVKDICEQLCQLYKAGAEVVGPIADSEGRIIEIPGEVRKNLSAVASGEPPEDGAVGSESGNRRDVADEDSDAEFSD